MGTHIFEIVDCGSYRIVEVRGDVDLDNAAELASAMTAASRATPIVVDLSACSYLDSTGLSVLIRHERQHRGRMAIVAPLGHRSLHLLEITGLALTLHVMPSLDEAIDFCEFRRTSAATAGRGYLGAAS